MRKYNIVFATDESYIQHVAVTLISLLENNTNIFLNIYYIIDGISLENKRKILSLVKKYSCKLEFIEIDGEIFNSMVTGSHFNQSVYYRLMMADVIPEEESILYLDGDIVINGSIKLLLDINIRKSFVASIRNPGFERHKALLMDQNSNYFNSGVILANLVKWRTYKVLKKSIEYMSLNRTNIELADQDVLNAIINGNWIEVEPKYNQQAIFFEKEFERKYNCFTNEELKESRENPIIIHYTGSSKPWHFLNKHPYKNLYWKYLKKTPFYYSFVYKYYLEITVRITKAITKRIINYLTKLVSIKK